MANWHKCVPSVYFQKSVAIDNPRLWCVQTGSYIVIMIGVVWVLVALPVYTVNIEPQVRFDSWVHSATDIAGTSDPAFCSRSNLNQYTYMPSTESEWRFGGAECADVVSDFCGQQRTCVVASSIATSGMGYNFIATSFIEERYDAATAQVSKSSYIIPGIENVTLKHRAEFQIDLPFSWVHLAFQIALMATDQLEASLVDQNGNVVKRWMFDEARPAISLGRLMELAGVSLDEAIDGMLYEFPDNQGGGPSFRPRPRVTGLDMVLNAEISNALSDTDHEGPVAKLTVRALPAWMTHQKLVFTDNQGSTLTRHFHGIRVSNTNSGVLSWFQLNKVIYTWSLYSVWLQIPVYLVFYFAIMCLGTLSNVFKGFVYEEVDLHREFNGVSSRMLELTYGFHDLHDLEETDRLTWGATKGRIRNRVDRILDHDKNLDVAERTQFTNFIFDNSASSMPGGTKAMQLDDYRKPHMTNENLLFEDVLQIVDSDRQVGNMLERIFMDDSLKEFSAAAEKAEAEILGKRRAKRSGNHRANGGLQKLIDHCKAHKTLKVMGQINTIARANYGQEVILEQMGGLEKAFEKMYSTCEDVKNNNED
mmetsp:Transcript_34101/g.98149  ORF Transcript_34101/g.98149 Transcript_34101/m.98149 type:complete len:591 (+) Transcript_34101:95-1867(+)